MTQTDNNDQALVPLDQHLPAVPRDQGDVSILQRMARGALEIARLQALAAQARYRVGDYELAKPDYRQVLLWAERLRMTPEEVLERLSRFRYPVERGEPLELVIMDGQIRTLIWDVKALPMDAFMWQSGLNLETLAVTGNIPDWAADQVLPSLRRMFVSSFGFTWLDPSHVPGLGPHFKASLRSFPGGIDEATYAKAKPHFEAALRSFQEAGQTLKDLFKFLIQNFGAGIKPYAVRFALEQGLGANLGAAKTETATHTLAQWVCEQLQTAAEPIAWRELFRQADAAFGGTQAAGVNTPKDAYDAMESGINQYILSRLWLENRPINPGCSLNPQTVLDLSPVPGLIELICSNNKLVKIDLTPVPGLTVLNCSKNQLIELDLDPVPGLTKLDCLNNPLTELDLRPLANKIDLLVDDHVRLIR